MRVGIFQCAGGNLSIDEKISRLHNAIVTAQSELSKKLDLVVCPELFTSGYNVGNDLITRAEPAQGPTFQRFAKLSQELDIGIVYGYPEQWEKRIYNSAAFVSSNGDLLANHRKQLNSPGSFEEDYFATGNCTTLLSYGGLKISIVICYEVEFPESIRCAAANGAQLILVPTALVDQWGVVANKVVPTRAFENGVWIAYANHAGHENGFQYLGASKIVAPDGHIEACAGTEETLITASIDIKRVEAAQQRMPYLRDFKRYICQP
jgi:predicted amidohydrolase